MILREPNLLHLQSFRHPLECTGVSAALRMCANGRVLAEGGGRDAEVRFKCAVEIRRIPEAGALGDLINGLVCVEQEEAGIVHPGVAHQVGEGLYPSPARKEER